MQWQKNMQLIDANVILRWILDVVSCTEEKCVRMAMDIYTSISLDFVDCLLIAYHKINNENIFSFDKKLNKYLN